VIVSKVQTDTGRKVALEERVDPDLLGGLVLRVGGIAIDGSLRTRIERLRRTLTEAPIEAAAAS
jgi:F-type H+-transporting ATPase subunit delta